jgi:hypothetical protein
MTFVPATTQPGRRPVVVAPERLLILSDHDCVDHARMNHGSRASVIDRLGNDTTNGEIRAGKLLPRDSDIVQLHGCEVVGILISSSATEGFLPKVGRRVWLQGSAWRTCVKSLVRSSHRIEARPG